VQQAIIFNNSKLNQTDTTTITTTISITVQDHYKML